jgi:hypothetical protein
VRGKHQIVIARLDDEITHRHGGEVARLELRPRGAAIDGDPQAELRPGEQQVGRDDVLRITCTYPRRVWSGPAIRRHVCPSSSVRKM